MQFLPPAALKSGETLEILRIPAPCGDWAERLVEFMYLRHPEYTNCSWHLNCKRVVAGDCAEVSSDVFFVGLLDGEIVGTSWYAAPADTLDLGCFGRVLTLAEHRRKGISRHLCAAAVDDFRDRGGWCMHLGTGRNNPARFIYEDLGFRHHNFVEDGETIMRAVLRGDYDTFEMDYFGGDEPVTVRPMHWGDLARAELLYNLPHWFLKDYSQGVYANTPFEGQFFDLIAPVMDSGETGLALQTHAGRMVGMAYTARTNAQAGAQDHLRVLEFLVHPAYAENAPALLAAVALEATAAKLIACSSALDVSRCEVLEEAGFRHEATLANALQDAETEFDLYVYEWSQ
ncbi:MAG: GNAT family N-acetyltransferase [Armatimonadia bacterium]